MSELMTGLPVPPPGHRWATLGDAADALGVSRAFLSTKIYRATPEQLAAFGAVKLVGSWLILLDERPAETARLCHLDCGGAS